MKKKTWIRGDVYAHILALNEPDFFHANTDIFRQFLTKNYPAFKQENPTTPVLIREAFGVRPAAFARFEYGKESKVHLDGINEEQIEKTLNLLINQK